MAGYYNFAHRGQLTPDAISRDIEFLAYHGSPYGKLMKEIRRTKDDIMSGNDTRFMDVDAAVAKVVDEFIANGTDTVRMPIWNRLQAIPSAGDDTLIGKSGAQLQVAQRPIYICALGAEVPVNNGPGNRLRSKNVAPGGLIALHRKAIGKWWSDILTESITRAIYEGFPSHIHLATADKSPYSLLGTPLNKGRRHHRHIYVAGAGQGWQSYSTTHTTYDATIAAAVVSCKADPSNAAQANSDALNAMYEYLVYQQSEPFGELNNVPFWRVYCTPEQMNQFGNDSKIQAATMNAYRGMKGDDPNLVGGSLFYRHFQIVQDPKIAWEVHGAAVRPSTGADAAGWRVRYGAMDSDERYELNNAFNYQSTDAADRVMKAAVVMGKNVAVIGQGGSIDTSEVPSGDKRSVDIYSELMTGVARSDVFFGTDSDSPDSVVYKGGALLITNSPAQ